jgi:hypothetical protein
MNHQHESVSIPGPFYVGCRHGLRLEAGFWRALFQLPRVGYMAMSGDRQRVAPSSRNFPPRCRIIPILAAEIVRGRR